MSAGAPSILPFAYFPPAWYFRVLIENPGCIFESHEHFIRQTIRNRCTILNPNGKQFLTVPVTKPFGNKTPMEKVLASENENWRKNHLRAIQTSYGSAPYFNEFFPELKDLISSHQTSLIELNIAGVKWVCGLLGISNEFKFSHEYFTGHTGLDFRGIKNQKDALPEMLNRQEERPYTQVFSGLFIPGLSILDQLFCLGPEAADRLKDTIG